MLVLGVAKNICLERTLLTDFSLHYVASQISPTVMFSSHLMLEYATAITSSVVHFNINHTITGRRV